MQLAGCLIFLFRSAPRKPADLNQGGHETLPKHLWSTAVASFQALTQHLPADLSGVLPELGFLSS